MSNDKKKSKPDDEQPKKYVLGLDAVGKRSLTLNQYKELKARDPKTLSAAEKRKLKEADEMLSESMKRIADAYDFSAIAKLAQIQIPTGVFDAVRKMSESATFANAALLSVKTQLPALAALQKSILTDYGPSLSRLGELVSGSLAAQSMFADISTSHARLIKSLSINIGSLTAGLEISKWQAIDLDITDVKADTVLEADVLAVQKHSVGDLVQTDEASMDIMFKELQATRQELAELKQILLSGKAHTIDRVSPAEILFRRTESTLHIGNYKVTVSLSSKQAQFTGVLISSPESVTRKWDIEELVFEAFGERIDGDEENWITKIRSYIFQLNQKINAASFNTMPNFFVLDGLDVYINPKYLGNL